MTMIGGLDIHRAQITFDYLDTETGEVRTGQVRPATRAALRDWLGQRFCERDEVKLAVEGCTGWRFVVEEMQRAGVEAHLAEPADTASKRGPKKRAKTDKADARLLRDLLCDGRLPESWIPPRHLLEVRTLGRLYLSLAAQRRAWLQRIHAQLYHQGAAPVTGLLTCEGRAQLAAAELSAAGRQAVETALSMIEALEQQIRPLREQLRSLGNRLPGARALQAHYGIGSLCAVIIWAELGDCRRFSSSDQAVRLSGLDVSVWSSDNKRAAGHLARQGPPALRWALFEASKCAARPGSPDHDYYQTVSDRLSSKRSTISVARKLARRCHHTLRELGDEAMALPEEPKAQAA
jgi:transposase